MSTGGLGLGLGLGLGTRPAMKRTFSMVGSPLSRATSPNFEEAQLASNAFFRTDLPDQINYRQILPPLPPLPELTLSLDLPEDTATAIVQTKQEVPPLDSTPTPEVKTTKQARKKRRTTVLPADHYQYHYFGSETAYVIPKGSILVPEDLHTSLIRTLVVNRSSR